MMTHKPRRNHHPSPSPHASRICMSHPPKTKPTKLHHAYHDTFADSDKYLTWHRSTGRVQPPRERYITPHCNRSRSFSSSDTSRSQPPLLLECSNPLSLSLEPLSLVPFFFALLLQIWHQWRRRRRFLWDWSLLPLILSRSSGLWVVGKLPFSLLFY